MSYRDFNLDKFRSIIDFPNKVNERWEDISLRISSSLFSTNKYVADGVFVKTIFIISKSFQYDQYVKKEKLLPVLA